MTTRDESGRSNVGDHGAGAIERRARGQHFLGARTKKLHIFLASALPPAAASLWATARPDDERHRLVLHLALAEQAGGGRRQRPPASWRAARRQACDDVPLPGAACHWLLSFGERGRLPMDDFPRRKGSMNLRATPRHTEGPSGSGKGGQAGQDDLERRCSGVHGHPVDRASGCGALWRTRPRERHSRDSPRCGLGVDPAPLPLP